MESRYQCHNRRKYNLQAHIILVTKYRRPILVGAIAVCVKQKVEDIAARHGWDIHAAEIDLDHLHLLLSYDPNTRVCDLIKALKQETTYTLWQLHSNILCRIYWKKHIFWSDGYFVCSVGEASATTIRHYIEEQG